VRSELFTPMDIGEMNLDRRQRDRSQGITNGDAGMGICSRIDEDPLGHPQSTLDCIHQRPFMVGLDYGYRAAELLRQIPESLIDGLKGIDAVDARFAGTEQIEVGTMEYKDIHMLPDRFMHRYWK